MENLAFVYTQNIISYGNNILSSENEVYMWHKNARFNVFTQMDVYDEDYNYLLVKNIVSDNDGKFDAIVYYRSFDANGNVSYVRDKHISVTDGCIKQFEKAQWNVARDIILHDLDVCMEKEVLRKDNAENNIAMIGSAKKSIAKNAKPGKQFKFMANKLKQSG